MVSFLDILHNSYILFHPVFGTNYRMPTFYFIGDEFQHNFYLLKECSKLSIVPDLKSDLNWKCLVAKAPTLTKANLKNLSICLSKIWAIGY